jgi:hypothetical protein
MAHVSLLNRPTPSIENVTDVPMLPMIKDSPSISKVSLDTQGVGWIQLQQGSRSILHH